MGTKTDNESVDFEVDSYKYEDGIEVNHVHGHQSRQWTNTRIGIDYPAWRSRVRRGLNATTPYSCNFQTFDTSARIDASAVVTEPTSTPHRTEFIIRGTPASWTTAASDPTPLAVAQADLTARSQFLSRYRSRRTQFQAGIFLGELRKTVKMIRSPVQALRESINGYVRLAKKRAYKAKYPHQAIAETWLEYAYGIKPLVSDAEDALRLATAHPYRVFERISGNGIDVQERAYTKLSYSSSACRVLYTRRSEGRVEVRIKGAIRAENNPPGFPEQCGLSWSNVLPTFWELIPYSFLVDYFTNVGKVIDGVSTGTVSLAWGSFSQKKIRQLEYVVTSLDWDYLESFGSAKATHSGHASGGGIASTRTNLDRNSINAVSVGLRDTQFKLPGSDLKWLNIGALATTRFRAGSRRIT